MSLDGRGRAIDNNIERHWRTEKWERHNLLEQRTMRALRCGLGENFEHYKHQRWHTALENRTPAAVYER